MHITNVKMFNFKSYKHYIFREQISPGINIFIGYNGSGKTTLFQAIDNFFNIISESFSKTEIPNHIECYFTKGNILSMIEIRFDNSDRFFPISNKQIIIRRIFGPNINKFIISNQPILPNQFFTFLNLRKVYLDNLIVKIEQGKHLDFKNSNYIDRLNFFVKNIGMNLFEIFEKRSFNYLLKLNIYKKKMLYFIRKLNMKEKLFARKLKILKKAKILNGEFLLLRKIFFLYRSGVLNNRFLNFIRIGCKKTKLFNIINQRSFLIAHERDILKLKCLYTQYKIYYQNRKSSEILIFRLIWSIIYLSNFLIKVLNCFSRFIRTSIKYFSRTNFNNLCRSSIIINCKHIFL
jgi:AAA15 family ATPase/GTPase